MADTTVTTDEVTGTATEAKAAAEQRATSEPAVPSNTERESPSPSDLDAKSSTGARGARTPQRAATAALSSPSASKRDSICGEGTAGWGRGVAPGSSSLGVWRVMGPSSIPAGTTDQELSVRLVCSTVGNSFMAGK
jgi:hypothetical protein